MKWPALILACCTFGSSPLFAQDVRVHLYTTIAPKTITVVAKAGDFRWRSCSTCEEHPDQKLLLNINAGREEGNPATTSKDLFINGSYQLLPSGGPAFSANFPLHIQRGDAAFTVIVTMPIENYVEAVLAAESGGVLEPESLKAMAVIIRTYAQKFRGRHSQDGFDFCDTTHCQVMRWDGVSSRGRAAAAATQGEVLMYHDAPAATYYHQDCGGTVAGANESWPDSIAEYLVAHPDPYCVIAGGLKWEHAIAVTEIDKALRDAGIDLPRGWASIEIATKTESGRAKRLILRGPSNPSYALSASSFRFAIGRALGWNKIRSDLYEIRNSSDQIIFSGRGAGHGVGLCQAGASEMAREGKTYREILNFYFPGTQLIAQQAEIWQSRTDERFELMSTNPEADSSILADASRILKENEEKIGWQIPFKIRLQVYSSLDRYRDATGRPGWVAAFTRAHTIRLQPIGDLRRRKILESTLRHELFHLLVELRAKPAIPLWFREGLVLSLASPRAAPAHISSMTDDQIDAILQQPATREDMDKAYAAAQSKVADLIQRYGLQKVCSWLTAGIPRDLGMNLLDLPALASNN
jgi:stage II sporulation protein D